MENVPTKVVIDIHVFRDYYDSYYNPLCRFLNLYTQDASIIEDVIQETLLKLWENRDDVEINYIKTYLFRAAKNRILNHLRDEQNRYYLLENWFNQQQQEIDHEDCYDIDKFTLILEQAINQLPDKCKETFLLNRRDQLSYKQIAEKQNLSVKTVEAQISIALKRIRDIMTSYTFLLLLLLMH